MVRRGVLVVELVVEWLPLIVMVIWYSPLRQEKTTNCKEIL
jgi:hypothetical protein